MAYNGNEGAQITLEEASKMTKNYRETAGLDATISHYVGRVNFEAILQQPNCVGIRTYYALDENGKKQLVFVGVNSQENDLYEGILVDKSILCPPICPGKNPLNSND